MRVLLTPGDEYVQQTGEAVRHLFAGVATYLDRYGQIRWPSTAQSAEELEEGLQDLRTWFGGQVSLSTLCGAILEIADKGLETFSQNTTVPPACASFARAKEARFCVGRDVRGLPLGAIIHGGRNQHVHWNEEKANLETGGFRLFTRGLFRALVDSYYSDPLMDLVYDLGNPFSGEPRSRADSLVLTTIRWREYEPYERDMRAMLA